MSDLKINFLDHVAIRVKDIKASVKWYESVLGLTEHQLEKWGDYPIFMLSDKSGVALFPANSNDPKIDLTSKNIKIDHFAFNVTQENFERAKDKFTQLDIPYQEQDHYYFRSIYIKDPDGHTVELTTLVVNEKQFYK